jgi:uncharacterized protein (DUF608 family)
MKNNIPYTSYENNVAELSRKGDAVEFIQPWYTPISTTPENTGIAVGGIGSTFTLTPKGTTPNFSMIPGIFIDCSEDDIEFNDFSMSVMETHALENLGIKDEFELQNHLKFYPALFNGKELDFESDENVFLQLIKTLRSGRFYTDNMESFKKWNVEFSKKTQCLIEKTPNSITCQVYVALDFFNGLLINKSAQSLSLSNNTASGLELIDSESVNFKSLYPLAEFDYHSNDIQVRRKVVSPLVRGDKKLCSLPLHWNHFEVTNQSDKTKLVTLTQALDNLLGATYQKGRAGIQDSACFLNQNPIKQSNTSVVIEDEVSQFIGISMTSDSPYEGDITGETLFGVQADKALIESGKVVVTSKTTSYKHKVAGNVVAALRTGRTNNHFDSGIYTTREALSGLMSVCLELSPGETLSFKFAQVMEHSKISLNGWESDKAYKQFYTGKEIAQNILKDTLPKLDQIEADIVEQQNAFLSKAQANFADDATANRFSTMAMNTLSFLSESTVWDVEDKFLVKECVDYPFFNSLDVYFYGSFSLLYLLPELDGSVMKEFANAIMAEDPTLRRYWEYEDKPDAELIAAKFEGTRAVKGAVIHDLGSPFDIQPDAYSWHNVKEWKDLAPKYILMVFRHYQNTKDLSVVKHCWPAILESMEFLSNLIESGDTLPLTRGTDDTFDNLASHGISIYCASLWSAGLKAASELAQLLGESELAKGYISKSEAALTTLESGLWDEKKGYYHFFVTPIQSKHLTGNGIAELAKLGLNVIGEPRHDKAVLNAYLDDVDLASTESKLQQRTTKKQQLVDIAPTAFTNEYQNLVPDSDNSFGDALLADSYLKLIGLEGLFPSDRISRTLDYIYQHNFVINSPKLGVANMTLADGAPHEAFQAQDVWIGVQFSMATALRLAGKNEQAQTILNTVYDALYNLAKIPFAAPEGFNCSVAVDEQSLVEQFGIDASTASTWLKQLVASGNLLADGRVSPDIEKDVAQFAKQVSLNIEASALQSVHKWLLSTGLKYTAGRYFRPGMIFAYLYA